MTYSHPTTDELVMIESYYHQNISVAMIAERLRRSRQPIYNVINFLKQGNSAIDYYKRYKVYKKRCGRHKIIFVNFKFKLATTGNSFVWYRNCLVILNQ